MADPEVREAFQVRVAHLLGGGYDETARAVPEWLRRVTLAVNGGRCRRCNVAPATEVDHIAGPSAAPSNLQGLCHSCHIAKTKESHKPIGPEHEPILAEVRRRVDSPIPLRVCDDA
ncbi:MAG: HNH endonuclease, partial [Pseudonocardiaceae bacterium]